MTGIRRYVAVLCVLLVAAPASVFAADPPEAKPGNGVVGWVTNPYRPVMEPTGSLTDSTRLESLLRAGNLYQSSSVKPW